MLESLDIKKTILAVVKALDTLNPILKNHHRRVAIIAYGIGKKMALTDEEMSDLVIASSIHDIGAISVADSEALEELDMIDPKPHEALGAFMIEDFPLFEKISRILMHHHVNYEASRALEEGTMPIEAHILHLADRIDILLKSHTIAINQKDEVMLVLESLGAEVFEPKVYGALLEAASEEQFWLDIDLLTISLLFEHITYEHLIQVKDIDMIEGLASTISHIIDYRTEYSVANSIKVAYTAEKIARTMALGDEVCFDVKIAGYLHDLGMISVPTEILNKKSALTEEERNIIKLHPYHTKRILSSIQGFERISRLSGAHHVRYDEANYFLDTEYIVEREVLIMADVFSALTSVRAYRDRYSYEEIIGILEAEFVPAIGNQVFEVLKTIGQELYSELLDIEAEMLNRYKAKTVAPRSDYVNGYHYLRTELYNLVQTDPDIFDFIQEGALDGMWYWDLENPEHEWMNPKFWRILGYKAEEKEHLACEWQDIIFEEDLQMAMNNFNQHCEDPSQPYDQVVRYWHRDGHVVWVRCRGIAIRNKFGKPVRMLGAHTEITKLMHLQTVLRDRNYVLVEQKKEIEKLNKELRTMSSIDYLTGLYNRQTIDNFLDEEAKRVKRDQEAFTIMMIDINYFKAINDTYGHLVGDQVLVDFAHRLQDALRDQDVKARWGGDEFMVILPSTGYKFAEVLLDRFLKDMNQWHIMVDDDQIHYTITIGMSTYDGEEDVLNTVLRADTELYRLKSQRDQKK